MVPPSRDGRAFRRWRPLPRPGVPGLVAVRGSQDDSDSWGAPMRPDLTDLRRHFRGSILSAYDPGYEPARVLFNTRIRTRPAVLCRCADTADVVTAVRFARDAGLPVAVRGGGHHAGGLSLVDQGLVIDVGGLRDVTLDGAEVTTGAGAGWREIDRVTLAAGLAAPGGE